MMEQTSKKSVRVAIVTPVYNGEKFLAETMACIQKQTYPNVVHIVVDNASTDSTPDIIERYADGPVPLVVRRNAQVLPLYQNWETSLRLVGTDVSYFLILCADDLIAPDAIERLVEIAEIDPEINVVGCRWALGTEPNFKDNIQGGGLPESLSTFDGRWFVRAYLARFHSGTSPQCQLFRRTLLEDGVPFHKYDEILMDVDACLRVSIQGKYGFVHAPLGFTREHDERTTKKVKKATEEFTINWLDLIDRHGPMVMSSSDFAECRDAFLRHYFRRLLLWRFRDKNDELYHRHLALLSQRGVRPTVRKYSRALLEWLVLAARGARGDVGAATSLWPRVRLDLAKMSG
jgi:glycosyltransferase involved in cell wall biosynthesis